MISPNLTEPHVRKRESFQYTCGRWSVHIKRAPFKLGWFAQLVDGEMFRGPFVLMLFGPHVAWWWRSDLSDILNKADWEATR